MKGCPWANFVPFNTRMKHTTKRTLTTAALIALTGGLLLMPASAQTPEPTVHPCLTHISETRDKVDVSFDSVDNGILATITTDDATMAQKMTDRLPLLHNLASRFDGKVDIETIEVEDGFQVKATSSDEVIQEKLTKIKDRGGRFKGMMKHFSLAKFLGGK